jgi:non-specific serine/threonine protein kinase
LGEKIGGGLDIWSFGCLVFELLTGVSLFSVMVLHEDHQERTDDYHLVQINDILEPLPDIWIEEKWPGAKTFSAPTEKDLVHVLAAKRSPISMTLWRCDSRNTSRMVLMI